MFYEEVFRALNKAGVRYLVVGGLAVNFHGVQRPTHDIDLLIDMTSENINTLITAMEALGCRPRVPVDPHLLADETIRQQWIKEKNMKAFTFVRPSSEAMEVDILLESPLDFEEAETRRENVEFAGISVPVIAIPDLIRMKEAVARSSDLWDIKTLRRIQESEKK